MSSTRKLNAKNICVVGADELGVSVASVVAFKCPHLSVSVVDLDPREVNQWDDKNLRQDIDPTLQDFLAKCRGQNLFFGTNIKEMIAGTDVIFLMINNPDPANEKMSEIKDLEKVVRIIAEVSEDSKIVVQKSANVPVKMCETLGKILDKNKSKKANFQVLSMPEFFTSSSPISHLLNPDFVFIGHEESLEGEKAAGIMMGLYTKWVPKERIMLMDYNLVDMSKLFINVFLAQKLMMMSGIYAICEKSEKKFQDIGANIIKASLDSWFLESTFNVCDINMYRDMMKLIQLCDKYGPKTLKEYWNEVINQNDDLENRFRKKILSAFANSVNNRKFAFLGITTKANGKITNELYAIRLGTKLLEENAELSVYDPCIQTNHERLLEVFKVSGAEKVEERVSVYTDPYEAARRANGIIFCTDSKNFRALDFVTLYKEMNKPAYIFDGWNSLDYKTLLKIGFKVKTIGRALPSERGG